MIPFSLAEFDPINLKQMDAVKLMNRIDTKFIFHINKLPDIIKCIERHYFILEVANDLRYTNYETLYFDTSNFALYFSHHNGKLNRYKIRYRKYINTNMHFFEIKFKNNKSRTIKSRIKQNAIETIINGKAKKFLESSTPLVSASLLPAIWVNYSRITFVNKNMGERLTIDFNLSFKVGINKKQYDNLIIAEVKREKTCAKSPFIKLMCQHHIHPTPISKYCLGVTQLISGVRKNNFKPQLLNLNKILYAAT